MRGAVGKGWKVREAKTILQVIELPPVLRYYIYHHPYPFLTY